MLIMFKNPVIISPVINPVKTPVIINRPEPVVINTPIISATTTTTTTGGADPIWAPQMVRQMVVASNPYAINQRNLKETQIKTTEYKSTISSPLLLLGVAVVGGVLIYTSKTAVSTAYKTVATTAESGYKAVETAYKTVA